MEKFIKKTKKTKRNQTFRYWDLLSSQESLYGTNPLFHRCSCGSLFVNERPRLDLFGTPLPSLVPSDSRSSIPFDRILRSFGSMTMSPSIKLTSSAVLENKIKRNLDFALIPLIFARLYYLILPYIFAQTIFAPLIFAHPSKTPIRAPFIFAHLLCAKIKGA